MRVPVLSTVALAALAVLALLPAIAGAGQPATPPAAGTIAHPAGADEVVLRIDEISGFVPVEYVLRLMPSFTLYGDGRAIVQGAITMIYPGPALPNLRQVRLTEEGVQAVLAEARAAGLLDGDRALANAMVTDLPTTVFIATAGDRTSTVSVYGLGIAEDQLPATARAERRALQAFQGRLFDLAGRLPADAIAEADQSYAIDCLQVISQPMPADAATPTADGDTPRAVLDWPLAGSLATAGEPPIAIRYPIEGARCFVAEGPEAERLVMALAPANALTLWRSGNGVFAVYPRPLLPDESGCGAEATGTPAATPAGA